MILKNILLFAFITMQLTLYAPDVSSRQKVLHKKIMENQRIQRELELRINCIERSEFNYDNFVEYVELIGIESSEIVLRQAVLETGWFTSTIFKENLNIFGMKKAYTRQTTAIGESLGHAKYNHWTDSVKDYLLWQEYYEQRYEITRNYYHFLSRIGYAENEHYILLLKNVDLTQLYNGITDRDNTC